MKDNQINSININNININSESNNKIFLNNNNTLQFNNTTTVNDLNIPETFPPLRMEPKLLRNEFEKFNKRKDQLLQIGGLALKLEKSKQESMIKLLFNKDNASEYILKKKSLFLK